MEVPWFVYIESPALIESLALVESYVTHWSNSSLSSSLRCQRKLIPLEV